MDAFDADVLIYAAIPGHPLGRRVAAMFANASRSKPAHKAGIGSALLLPEVLSKPIRDGETATVKILNGLLARLDLLPVDRATALLATVLGARYKLRAADAIHLATAVNMGAARFITNNHRDFTDAIKEIDVVYPEEIPDTA